MDKGKCKKQREQNQRVIAAGNTDRTDNESGMMVVEAVLSFTVFIMVTLAIVYLINIFTIHNRIQFAINTTAKQISSYTYLYEGLGLRDGEDAVQGDTDKYVTPLDDTAATVLGAYNNIQKTLNDMEGVSNTVQELSPANIQTLVTQIDQTAKDAQAAGTSIKSSAEKLTDLFSDPDALMAGIVYTCISRGIYEIKSAVAAAAATVLTKSSLNTNGYADADDYLKAYGITEGYAGLDFSGSTMMCDNGRRMIDIVVQYDIDMGFLAFIMPEAKIHIVQRASVPAWVDGDGAQAPAKNKSNGAQTPSQNENNGGGDGK